MRKAVVLGLSAMLLAGGVVPSEARFRFRGGGHAAPVRAPSATTGLAVMPAFTLRSDPSRAASPGADGLDTAPAVMNAEAPAHGVERTVPIAAPMPALPPAPVARKEAGPWCASGRVAGSGTGFCLIN